MRVTTRFRVRTVMAIVAFIALGFSVTFELDHLYWGARMYDQADDLDRHLEAVEARLLLPVPTSR